MSLTIKKPNYLNTSKLSNEDFKKSWENLKDKQDHPFVQFKLLVEKSWNVKNADLEKAINLNKELLKIENLDMPLDELTNRSLITYIDAPWGSGKTFFIESLVRWIKNIKQPIKFQLSNKDSVNSELDINVINAWEVYNATNIEEILKIIYQPKMDKKFKEIVDRNNNKYSKKNLQQTLLQGIKRFAFIGIAFLENVPSPLSPLVKTISQVSEKAIKEKWWKPQKSLKNEEVHNEFYEKFKNENKAVLIKSIVDWIEEKYQHNNKMIFIDNIERLDSINRLDVINKILNWANIKGTTFIFLTNFQKLKISTIFEEDFWNKISLYETFKLTNDWKNYIENYQHSNFAISKPEFNDFREFLINIIPTFFNTNEDNMDIREIRKLLDNWTFKHQNNITAKEMIISLLKEIINNHLEGLEKYFFINYSISWLSEHKWNLWKDDLPQNICNDEAINNTENNTPLINNKMFRIQSNFFHLEVTIKKDIITFEQTNKIEIKPEEKIFFKKFNNFIDDKATMLFYEKVKDILKTRQIENNNNYIYQYINWIKKEKPQTTVKYFEFKYNNIRKLHIYNDIFNN